jgi:hypothetical protein
MLHITFSNKRPTISIAIASPTITGKTVAADHRSTAKAITANNTRSEISRDLQTLR